MSVAFRSAVVGAMLIAGILFGILTYVESIDRKIVRGQDCAIAQVFLKLFSSDLLPFSEIEKWEPSIDPGEIAFARQYYLFNRAFSIGLLCDAQGMVLADLPLYE